jgi:hypothetical protein
MIERVPNLSMTNAELLLKEVQLTAFASKDDKQYVKIRKNLRDAIDEYFRQRDILVIQNKK